MQEKARAKAKAKAACRPPSTPEPKTRVKKATAPKASARSPKTTNAKPKAAPKRRPRGSPPQHVREPEVIDEMRQERLNASQEKADENLKLVRQSGLQDLQPDLGFTAKPLGCTCHAYEDYLSSPVASIALSCKLRSYRICPPATRSMDNACPITNALYNGTIYVNRTLRPTNAEAHNATRATAMHMLVLCFHAFLCELVPQCLLIKLWQQQVNVDKKGGSSLAFMKHGGLSRTTLV